MDTRTPATSLSPLDALPAVNRFAALPDDFYSVQPPTPLPDPYLVHANADAARLIDLDPAVFGTPDFTDFAIGNRLPPWAKPVSALYCGHQFGVFVPQLGDGRAILIGSTTNARGEHWELQWKGAGLTPYSRMGDGRAVLRSSIREYLCSEAMAALGIPTTRALSVAGSDAPIYRETTETAAVVIRMAPSFVRFGSFEVFFSRGQTDLLRQLADYVIDHDLPHCRKATNPYLAMLQEVVDRTADLMAAWQAVGFCHGVMNTDNMSILGLTLDYGPFGFMEAFNPGYICNHSDHSGRYAYHRQPGIGLWNLQVLASVLLPLIEDRDAAVAALESYIPRFEAAHLSRLSAKLGLAEPQPEDDRLLSDTLTLMAQNRVDFTLFWRQLSGVKRDPAAGHPAVRDLFVDVAAFDVWLERYRARLAQEPRDDTARAVAMNQVNPKYVLRNYLAQVAIEKAQQKDYSELNRLLAILRRPFDEQPEHEVYAALPPDWAAGIEVSCSS